MPSIINNKLFKKIKVAISNLFSRTENMWRLFFSLAFLWFTLVLFWVVFSSHSFSEFLPIILYPSLKFWITFLITVFLSIFLIKLNYSDLKFNFKRISNSLIISLFFSLFILFLIKVGLIINLQWLKDLDIFFKIFVLCINLATWSTLVLIEPIYEKMKLNSFVYKINWLKVLPWLLFSLGVLVYGSFTLFQFNGFGYPLRDLGIFDQAVWSLSHFQVPLSTVRGMPNLWADHFHPILALLAPFYWLKSDVRILLLLQVIIVSAGSIPIFLIAQEKLKNYFLAFAISFSWLFFIGIQHAIRFGFYPETLVITFLAFAFYYFWKKKIWQYFVFIVLALACKENISLYVLFIGIYLTFFENWKIGVSTILLSLFWFKGALVIVSYLNHGVYQYFDYKQLGATQTEVIKTIFTKPIYTLQVFFSPNVKIETMLYYFTSAGFLSFFSPFFIVLLPNLGEKFLSSRPVLWPMIFHYNAGIATALFISVIMGLKNVFRTKWLVSYIGYRLKIIIGFTLIFICLSISFMTASNPFMAFKKSSFYEFRRDPEITKVFKLIPTSAPVSAQDTIGTSLAHRKEIYHWQGEAKGDYIILSPKYSTFPFDIKQYCGEIEKLENNPDYGIVYLSDKVVLFQRNYVNQLRSNFVECQNFKQ